jgi:hypothetical protein
VFRLSAPGSAQPALNPSVLFSMLRSAAGAEAGGKGGRLSGSLSRALCLRSLPLMAGPSHWHHRASARRLSARA